MLSSRGREVRVGLESRDCSGFLGGTDGAGL